MFKLKNIISAYLPPVYQSGTDVLSEEQKYNESLAESLDDETVQYIVNFVANTCDYRTILDKLVPTVELGLYIEESLISNDDYLRKKLLSHYSKIITMKGSIASYELFFRLIGFIVDTRIPTGMRLFTEKEHYYVSGAADGYITLDGDNIPTGTKWEVVTTETLNLSAQVNAQLERMTVVEQFGIGNGWDSPYTFDDPDRTFDSDNSFGAGYYVELYGTFALGNPLLYDVFKIIEFLEPIDAVLLGVLYNGEELTRLIMRVYIDENGDLIYDNTADPSTTFSLDSLGNILVNGPNAYLYTLDADGNLWYNG